MSSSVNELKTRTIGEALSEMTIGATACENLIN